MSLSKRLSFRAWRCILSSRSFLGGISSRADPRLNEDSDCHGYSFGFRSGGDHNRGYSGNGKFGSNDESGDILGGTGESSNSRVNAAPRHENITSAGKFGRNRRSQSHNVGVGGRKRTTHRNSANSRRGGFEDGFRMPDFDPGNDQLKKIFESQLDSYDPIGGLDLGEVGPIEGNFRDDDDSEAEDFYKGA